MNCRTFSQNPGMQGKSHHHHIRSKSLALVLSQATHKIDTAILMLTVLVRHWFHTTSSPELSSCSKAQSWTFTTEERRLSLLACGRLCWHNSPTGEETLEPPHTSVTPQPQHRHHDVSVVVACHSTSHTRVTVLKWQLVCDTNEAWPHPYHPRFPLPQRLAQL